MKTYFGDRTIDGILVTVDGEPLQPRDDVRNYAGGDFEWSYEGPAPRQLAFAILMDHFGDGKRAEAFAERFMKDVVANFQNEWEMSTADVNDVVATYDAAGARLHAGG